MGTLHSMTRLSKVAIASRLNLLIVLCSILLQGGIVQQARAQYIQLSSSETSTDLDDKYKNLAATAQPRINPSLYRDRVNDSLSRHIDQYRRKYDNTLGTATRYGARYENELRAIKGYRNKYAGDIRGDLNQAGLSEKLNNYRRESGFDKNYQKYMRAASKAQSLSNQFLSGKLKLDSNTIVNNKLMKTYMDSLNKIIPKIPTVPFKEVPKDQLLKEINDRFMEKADSLQDSSKWVGRAKKKKEWVDLNYARLKSTRLNSSHGYIS